MARFSLDFGPRRLIVALLICLLVGCGGGGSDSAGTPGGGGVNDRAENDNDGKGGDGGDTDNGGTDGGGGDTDSGGSDSDGGETDSESGDAPTDAEEQDYSFLAGVWLLPCDEDVRQGFKIIGTKAELLHRFYQFDDCVGTGTDVALASFDLAIGEELTTDGGLEAHQVDLTFTSTPTDLDTYVEGDTLYTIASTDDSTSTLYFGAFADSGAARPSALNFLESYAHDTAGNLPPVADAGSDRTVESGSAVTLNGTGSDDVDGQLLGYAWAQTGGTPVSLANASSEIASFTSPRITTSEDLTFILTVTDDSGVSVTDTVTITVDPDSTSSDLTAEFSMRVEGPIGTTGGYMNDPVTMTFGTSNDHFQNYSPSPKFSWGYYQSGDLTEEEMNNLADEDFTVFSDQKTHAGLTFTYEFDELYPNTETNYYYFRLVIERPDGTLVRHTKKAVFPMVRAQGYLEVDGVIYPLGPEAFEDFPPYDHTRITFENRDPVVEGEELPYTVIDIPYKNDIFPEFVQIEVVTRFPAQSLPIVFYQLGDNPNTYYSAYSNRGFYFAFGEYTTFDDPSGHYSSGGWALDGADGHPDIQGALSLEMTLRGNYGEDETDEIQAKLHLNFITREDLNIWDL